MFSYTGSDLGRVDAGEVDVVVGPDAATTAVTLTRRLAHDPCRRSP